MTIMLAIYFIGAGAAFVAFLALNLEGGSPPPISARDCAVAGIVAALWPAIAVWTAVWLAAGALFPNRNVAR